MITLLLTLALLVATPAPHVIPGIPQAPMFVPAKLDDAGLSANAFRVFGRICRRWSPERGCYEAKAKMARACRMKRQTVYNALNELEERGFIERDGRRIDPLPPSSWLATSVPPNGPIDEGEVCPETDLPEDEVCPETDTTMPPNGTPDYAPDGDSGLCPQTGHKGIPPKGSLDGTPLRNTTTEVDRESGVEPNAERVVVLDGEGKADDPDRDAKNRAWQMLKVRDVAQAQPLAAEHFAVVPAAVEVYDRGLADGSIGGPGWFSGALPSWRTPRVAPARQAATHTGRLPEGLSGNVVERQAQAEPPRDPDAARRAIASEMPDWRPAQTEPDAPRPAPSLASLDAETDAAIDALPADERRQLDADAERETLRQLHANGIEVAPDQPAFRTAAAGVRRDLYRQHQD